MNVNIKGVGVVSFPDSMPPDKVQLRAKAIAASHAGTEPQPESPLHQGLRYLHAQLPLLAAAGTQAAFPEAPGLAAVLGGAGGRAIQQATAPMLGEQGPASPLEAYKQQLSSGATQGFLARGPQEVAREIQPGAKRLMEAALRKWGPSGERAAGTAIQERIAPGFKGTVVKQIDDALQGLGARVNTMLQSASDQGLWHDPRQVVQGTNSLLSKASFTDPEKRQIAKWGDEFLEGKAIDAEGNPLRATKPINPPDLNEIRQRYDDEAKAIYKLEGEKGPQSLRARWAKAMADQARGMLQDPEVTPNAVPGLQQVQGQISDLKNLRGIVKPEVVRSFARGALPYLPGAGAGAIAAAAVPTHSWQVRAAAGLGVGLLGSPQGLSNLSLLMTQPGGAQAVSNMLRLGAAPVDVTSTDRYSQNRALKESTLSGSQ